MATYYWVGGAGTWNASSTTNWASSSGGAGGAGVPTSADDVIFDTNSGTGTITFSGVCVCRNLTVTSTQAITFGSGTFYGIYGSLSLPTGGSFTWTGVPVTFRATTSGNTLNWGDKSTSQQITFDGAGGDWTLSSNMTGFGINFYRGTFSAGSYNLTCTNGHFTLGNGNTFVLNMGSGTWQAGDTSMWFTNPTNFTLNAQTSTIVAPASQVAFYGGGFTYYNFVYNTTNSGNVFVMSGDNTFNSITIGAATNNVRTISFAGNQTIGTLTTSGTTASLRIQFQSSVAGTQRTLSVASIGTLTNTNWKDIALTGAASPWTAPLGVWDLGNNSGITFDATTLYWVGGTGNWSDGTKWSASSGGSSVGGVPGPTNSVVFDSNSGTPLNIGTAGTWYCNNITGTPNAQFGHSGSYGTLNVYGSLDYAAGFGGYYTSLVFLASSAKTIALRSSSMSLVFNNANGSWTFTADTGNFGFSGSGFSLLAGTLDTNGYAINNANISTSGTLARTLRFGSSTIYFGSLNIASTTNLTFDVGTSTLVGTFHSSSFKGSGLTFNNVEFSSYFTNVTGANTFANLKVNATIAFISANQTVTGTLTLAGTDAANRSRLMSATDGTQYTVTAGAASITNADFYGIVGAGTATWSGTSVGDMSLNSNITFSTPKTVYWSLAAGGDWKSSIAWASTSGGIPAVANFPLPQDTAVFDNAGLNASATVTFPFGQYGVMSKIDCSTRTNAMTLSFNYTQYKWWFCGDITLGSGVTVSTSTYYPVAYFLGSTSLTSAGKMWTSPITITTGATLATADGFTSSNSITNNGTFITGSTITQKPGSGQGNLVNNGTLTLGANATVDYLALGASSVTNFGLYKISIARGANPIFTGNKTQVATGSKVIDYIYSGSGIVGLATNNPTEANALSFNFTSGSYQLNLSGSYNNLDFTGFSGSTDNTGATRTIYGNLTLSPTMTGFNDNGTTVFAATSGIKTITTNGKTIGSAVTFNGVGGTWQFSGNALQAAANTTTLTNGTLDLNGNTYTCGSFATAAGTKNLTFNGGTLVCPGATTTAFNNANPTNFTTTAGTGVGKISMTGATAKTFVGGGSVYNCTLEQAGAGALTITGSNTFNDIDNTVQPVSVLFTAGTTNTFNNFSLNGTSGNLVTIGSVTAASHTLSKASGIVDVSYCSISRSTTTGGARWQAYTINGNVNGGNNTGWKFSAFSGNGLLFGSNF